MINSENKQLIFELMYKLHSQEGSLENLGAYMDNLKKELSSLESFNLATLSTEEFEGDLKEEWQRYVRYRAGLNK